MTARRAAWVGASALAVFVLRLAVGGSGTAGISFLYVVPVGLGAWWFGRRVAVGVALGCMGLYAVTIAVRPVDEAVASAVVRGVVLVAAALVVAELELRSRRLARTADELQAIRQALTPSAIPHLPGLDVAVKFMPAEHGVSGDFYLLTNGPHATNIAVVGDVCGHGPHAAKRATFARATLASVAASCDDPAEILGLVNRTLVERWSDGEFLTATCIVHDAEAGRVRWATAGHPRPIRLTDLSELDRGGPPLALDPRARFPGGDGRLIPPDGLLLYTDGLLDARAGAERYGRERFTRALAGCAERPVAEIAENLARSLTGFAGASLADDVCIMVLRSTPLLSSTTTPRT